MSNVQLHKVAYSPTRFLATPKFIYFELDYDFLNNLCIVFSMEQFKIKLFQAFWICSSNDELYTVPFFIHRIFISVSKVIIAFYLSVSCKFYIITLVFYTTSYLQLFFYLVNFFFFQLRPSVDSNDLTFPIACWQNLQCTSIRVGPRQTAYWGGLQRPSSG